MKESYLQHMPKVPHGVMTADEWKATMKRVSKICPDAEMYKQVTSQHRAEEPLYSYHQSQSMRQPL